MVGNVGFEPTVSWSQARRDNQTTLTPYILSRNFSLVAARSFFLKKKSRIFTPAHNNLEKDFKSYEMRGEIYGTQK